MNVKLKIFCAVVFIISLVIFLEPLLTSAATTTGYDLSEIERTAGNVSIDSLGVLAKEYSVPILVILVVLSGFSALLGFAFKPAKAVAGSMLGLGILFYLMVNFAPQIVGVLMAVIDSIMQRVTGG